MRTNPLWTDAEEAAYQRRIAGSYGRGRGYGSSVIPATMRGDHAVRLAACGRWRAAHHPRATVHGFDWRALRVELVAEAAPTGIRVFA